MKSIHEGVIDHTLNSTLDNHLSPIDIHSQSFVRVLRKVVEHAQSIENRERIMFTAQSHKRDSRYAYMDALVWWFTMYMGALTIPIRSVRRVLSDAQYHTYIRLCAITAHNGLCYFVDLTYLREFDDMRIKLSHYMPTMEFLFEAKGVVNTLSIDHGAEEAIIDLHRWIRTNPNIDAPHSLVQACITTNTYCDVEKREKDVLTELLTHYTISDLRWCFQKRTYVAEMADIIHEIVAWHRFANLSKFDRFALGMLFDDVQVMRESSYKIRSDTALGMYAIRRAIHLGVVITYDMLDFSLGENVKKLLWIIDQYMSITLAFSFLRSAPGELLVTLSLNDHGDFQQKSKTLANIILSTERK